MPRSSLDLVDGLDAVFAFAAAVQLRLDNGRDVTLPGERSLDGIVASLERFEAPDDEPFTDRVVALLRSPLPPSTATVRRLMRSLAGDAHNVTDCE